MALKRILTDLEVTGEILTDKVIISNGLPTQFLKANGDLDSNTYSVSSHTHTTAQITALTGYTLGVNAAISASDTLNAALGNIQAQISAKSNDIGVVHTTGDETIGGIKTFTPTVSAVTNLARGTILNPTLTATSNNDVLIGLDVTTVFANGAFTGVGNLAGRFQGVGNTSFQVKAITSVDNEYAEILLTPSSATNSYLGATFRSYRGANSRLGISSSVGAGYIERLSINSTSGNVLIGTTTDAGYKLDVNGTSRVGLFTVSSDSSSENNPQIFIKGATNSNQRLRIGFHTASNFGYIQALVEGGTYRPLVLNSLGGNILLGTSTDTGYKLDVNGSARLFGNTRIEGTQHHIFSSSMLNVGKLTSQFGNDAINFASASGENLAISYTSTGSARWRHLFSGQTMQFLNNNGLSVFHANNNGEVGIGGAPQTGYRLDVIGNLRASGTTTLTNLSGTGNRFVSVSATGVLSADTNPTTLAGYGITDGFKTLMGMNADLDTALSMGQSNWTTTAINTPYAGSYGTLINFVSHGGDTHNNTNNWLTQLGSATNNKLYIRQKTNSDAFTSWRTIWDSSTLTNINQLTTRSYTDLQNIPTTLAGYGITDAYTKTEENVKFVDFTTAQSISGIKTFSNGFVDNVTNIGKIFTTYQVISDGQWAQPIGKSIFVQPTSIGGPGTSGYWLTTGRRDALAGYSGIFTSFNGGSNSYIGSSPIGSNNPIWQKILTDTNFTSGTSATNWAAGNDSRILNGQTAFGWGNHAGFYLPLTGGDVSGKIVVTEGNRDGGMYGTYVSTKTQNIWGLGTAYKVAADGSSFGNHFGLAYKSSANINGVLNASGHQVVLVQNGTVTAAMGDNVWTSGQFIGAGTGLTGTASNLIVGRSTRLDTDRTIGITTGDVTSAGSIFNGSSNNTNVLTLATVNANVGTFGNAASVAQITVNAKGLTTAISNVPILIAQSQVTGLVTDLADKQPLLTNPITGTGTLHYLPKFTDANTLGNSNISDNGAVVVLNSDTRINGKIKASSNSTINPTINFEFQRSITNGGTSNLDGFGMIVESSVLSDVTRVATNIRSSITTQAAAFTLANLRHFEAQQSTAFGAGSVVNTQIAFYASVNLIGATNNYGFMSSIPSGTNNWNFYAQGTAKNYFAGNSLFGILTDDTVNKIQVVGGIKTDVLTISTIPTTSASTYDILTRNTAGIVEKVSSNTFILNGEKGIPLKSSTDYNVFKIGGTLSKFDFNSITEVGVYYALFNNGAQSTYNAPKSGGFWFVENKGGHANSITQYAHPYRIGDGYFVRTRAPDQVTWTSWAEIWTSVNFSQTSIDNWNTAFGWGNHATQGYLTSYIDTTYSAGSGLTLAGTIFSLPVTQAGSGNYISDVVQNANGITVTKSARPIPALVTSTVSTGVSNVVTGNTNTFLNVVESGVATGSSTQITGAGSITVSSDVNGKLTITGVDTNTVYTLPSATSTILGGMKLFSDTVQSVAANAISATASRTYGVQFNSAGQAVVNVPWVDTNNTYTGSTSIILSGSSFQRAALTGGDITGAQNVNTYTVNAGAITLAKMASVVTGSIFYRKTAGTGVPEVQTLATLKTDLGLSGTNTGDNAGVTSVATSGGYGGLTLSGGTITSTGTITLGGTPTGTWPISISGNASASGTLITSDTRIIAPSTGAAGRLTFGFTSFNNNNTAPWADYLHIRSYQDVSGGSDNLLSFSKGSIGMRIWQQTFGSTTAYSTYKDVAFTDGSNSSGTWGIGISGNAETATTLKIASYNGVNANTAGLGKHVNYNTGWNSQVGGPSTASFGTLYNLGGDTSSSLSLQVLADVNHNVTNSTKDFYFRTGNNLGFQNDWKKMWHDGNFNPANYLALTGGTMSGNISLGGTADISIQFSNAASADLYLGARGGTRIVEIRNGNYASPNYSACGLVTGSGDFRNGIMVGAGARTGNLSIANALAIGDSDTGFRQNGDGVLETYANNVLVRTDTSGGSNFALALSGTSAAFSSSVTATRFNGAGTGLTGTAAGLNIGGNATTATTAISLPTAYIGGQQLNPQTYFGSGTGLRVAMTAAAGVWSDTLWINGYNGGDVGNMCALHFKRDGTPRAYISTQLSYATTYGTMHELISSYTIGSQTVAAANKLNGNAFTNGGDGWFRSVGNTGWYNETWGGGIYMDEATTVKVYSGKKFFVGNNISAAGDVIAYSSSDIRLKDNIKPIPNALAKIDKIGGYSFDWNNNQDTYTGHDIGVIAQEIEAVLPELVTTRDNGFKAVKYDKLVALLIQGMKEQQEQINELKKLIYK